MGKVGRHTGTPNLTHEQVLRLDDISSDQHCTKQLRLKSVARILNFSAQNKLSQSTEFVQDC